MIVRSVLCAATLLGLVSLLGCEQITGRTCTDISIPALVVSVTDSMSGAGILLPGTTIIARDGAYADTAKYGATLSPASTEFPLAWNRGGTYTLRVERSGYTPWQRTGIDVDDDGCHPATVRLVARLQH